MHFRTLSFAALMIALAGCGANESPSAVSSTASTDATPKFVGLWAVSQEMCANPAWRFEPREVGTLGEVHCEFSSIAAVGDRYDIDAMCTAEAPPAPYDIQLAVSDNPRAMVVSGGPWVAPTQLVYCAPLPGE